MVFSDFSHVCTEVKKGIEITYSHNNTGEYSSILECYTVTNGKILQTCLWAVLRPTSVSIIPKEPPNEKT